MTPKKFQQDLQIYLKKIPPTGNRIFWVSFESDPKLKKTKEDIYGRCLPCIQNLYYQLKEGHRKIALGRAFNCWKIVGVVENVEDALTLLSEFEKRRPVEHIYGKLGNGKPEVNTIAVVFHVNDIKRRDLIKNTLELCAREMRIIKDIQLSRGCAVLYEELFGNWREWSAVSEIKYPENIDRILKRIEKVLYWAN